jgi:potassium channel subfamily K, other eukaryote
LYLPLAVASVGEAISSLALSRLRHKQRGLYEQSLRQNLTLQHLRVMDADGDGLVTREEYVNFMLLEMGVVSEEDLSALQQQFVSLDVSRSGYLDKEDLKLMAELRGATAKQQP